MGRYMDFVAKPSRMGKKVVVIVPTEFHKDIEKFIGKFMKFHAEEILESKNESN